MQKEREELTEVQIRLTKKQGYISIIFSGLSLLISILSFLFVVFNRIDTNKENTIIEIKKLKTIEIRSYDSLSVDPKNLYLTSDFEAEIINTSFNPITLISYDVITDSDGDFPDLDIKKLNKKFEEPLKIDPWNFKNFSFKVNIPIKKNDLFSATKEFSSTYLIIATTKQKMFISKINVIDDLGLMNNTNQNFLIESSVPIEISKTE